MRNRIAFRLALYFASALLLFALVISFIFLTLIRTSTMDGKKAELKARAEGIAEALYSADQETQVAGAVRGQGQMQGKARYAMYLRFLLDTETADAWIVDEDLELLTGKMAVAYQYADLPANAEALVKEAFRGETAFGEGFSGLLSAPTLTVAAPVMNSGKIVAALLLHTPVKEIADAAARGMDILLVSVALALLLSVLLSILLAVNMAKPLSRIRRAALRLADRDYNAKTEVTRKDEIGQLAAAVDTLSGRLAEAQQESENLEKLRRDFIANISHELKTPVTVIRGSLEALCEEVVTEPVKVKEYHRQMLAESVFLQRLVNDLLDLSRLQNTDFRMDMQEINICDVLGDAVRSASRAAGDKSIDIRLTMDSQILALNGDYARLRQMFLNVLSNAVKFSNPGGIVEVTLKGRTVTVTDFGCGIGKDDLPHIFDRFYKARPEENKEGTGLGLAIARQIADRHRITITVTSEPGKGAAFRFDI